MKRDTKKYGQSFSKNYSLMLSNTEQLNALKDMAEKFEDRLNQFKTQGKECFEAMKVARSNIMCLACSANAGSLVQSTDAASTLIKVSLGDCQALVGKCYPVWKFNFQLTTMTQYYAMLRIHEKKADRFDSKFKSAKELSESTLDKISSYFAQCDLNDKKEIECPKTSEFSSMTNIYKELCGFQFSANQENSYIEGDESVFADIDDNDEKEADKTAENEGKHAASIVHPPKIIPVKIISPTINIARVLQNAESNFGISIEQGAAYKGLIGNTNSGILAGDSVDTSNAGQSPGNNASRIVFGLAGIIAAMLSLS